MQNKKDWICALAWGGLLLTVTPSAQAAKYSALYRFPTGEVPYGTIAQDAAGNIYGTTGKTLFKLDTSGNITTLHTFSPTDGGPPNGVTLAADGNLYGTTNEGGGACGCGTVFKSDLAGNFTVLYDFTEVGDAGGYPSAGVIRDTAGNLYGTVPFQHTYGNVYKLDPAGNFTVLYNFTDYADGWGPDSLLMDPSGNLYGTAHGGANGAGVIFKIDTAGNFSVIYTFTGMADGADPVALIRDAAGNLYGAAEEGANTTVCSVRTSLGCGTLFKLDTAGNFTVLYTFDGGGKGAHPTGTFIADSAGNFYGSTNYSGNFLFVYKLDAAGNYTVLHKFNTANTAGLPGLSVFGRYVYGNTFLYANGGSGTVFKLHK